MKTIESKIVAFAKNTLKWRIFQRVKIYPRYYFSRNIFSEATLLSVENFTAKFISSNLPIHLYVSSQRQEEECQ